MRKIKYYKVIIHNMSANAPHNGFIDNKTSQKYLTYIDGNYAGMPDNLESAITKCRANYRWQQIIWQLGSLCQINNITDIECISASANTEATEVHFTVSYDEYHLPYLSIIDGTTELNPINTVKYLITNALYNNYYAHRAIVLNPTLVSGAPKSGDVLSARGEQTMYIDTLQVSNDRNYIMSNIEIEEVLGV